MYFYLISCACDLLYSHHLALASLGQRVPSHRTDVTVGLACMTVVVTSEKSLHGPRLRAENVHTKVGEFWQPVFASVTPVQYLETPAEHHVPVD